MRWTFHIHVEDSMCIFHLIDDYIIKILMVAYYLYWKSYRQFIRKLTTPKYERNFPPLVYVENAKISVYVETPHLFNILFWKCRADHTIPGGIFSVRKSYFTSVVFAISFAIIWQDFYVRQGLRDRPFLCEFFYMRGPGPGHIYIVACHGGGVSMQQNYLTSFVKLSRRR